MRFELDPFIDKIAYKRFISINIVISCGFPVSIPLFTVDARSSYERRTVTSCRFPWGGLEDLGVKGT